MENVMNAPDKRQLFIDRLVDLDETRVLELLRERMLSGDSALEILEDAQEGVRIVGERYQEGNYYVSGLMMAGEIFSEIADLIQPELTHLARGTATGQVLLGTIQGDIHDIGKNIFATFLQSHGFTVTDIGVDVPPEEFLKQAEENHPDIIAISGLLTTSFDYMKATVRLLRQSEDPQIAAIPIMVGGGLMNAKVCALIGADYWSIDAMMGTELCRQIMEDLNLNK
jgi:methanogenic corrinoid protein MtbC1